MMKNYKLIIILLLVVSNCYGALAQTDSRPNIIVIMTDQHSADAMSCVMGKEYLHTPNIDKLAANGVRFTSAYAPNPLCKPMRTSMMTGKFPHETGVETNSKKLIDPAKNVFLGKLFKDAGYETAYFGKWHVAFDSDKKETHGFDIFKEKESIVDPDLAAAFITKKHDKPFFTIASFLSPHEVCQLARKEDMPNFSFDHIPPMDVFPPMKENFDPPQNETDIMAYMRKSYHAERHFPVGGYTEYDWRKLAWGYYRLIERADQFVGTIMDALEASGQKDNTLIVFLSDHGECLGSHKWNQKTVFYDESARVPFIISGKGKTGVSDVMVNTGVDMIPTLCDFANIDIPSSLHGKSLKSVVLDKGSAIDRDFIVTENHMVQCEPVEGKDYKPKGRMIRSERYKYCIYNEGERRESLIDMKKDPLEKVNQADNPKYNKIKEQHRAYLKQHAEQHDDPVALAMYRHVKDN